MTLVVVAIYLAALVAIGAASARLARRTSEDFFIAARSLGPVLLLELFEPLAGAARRFAEASGVHIAALTQAADDAAHLLLAVADRALELLPALLLQFGALLFLLLPALQQLLVQQFGACKQRRRLFRRFLLALPLVFQTGDHLVHLPFAARRQEGLGIGQHRRI